MEKITGKCVDDYLKKNPEKKESVMKQCRAILSELHGAGFCHGDFRSPNILVHDSGQVCVIDFEWSGKIGVASYQFFMNLVRKERVGNEAVSCYPLRVTWCWLLSW